MSIAENKELVTRYYREVLNGRRPEVLDELLAPGFESRLGDWTVDAAGYRAAVDRSLATFAGLTVEILAQVAEEDLVATRWEARGQVRRPEGQGPQVVLTGMHFHRLAGGRIAAHWEELDTARLTKQLG